MHGEPTHAQLKHELDGMQKTIDAMQADINEIKGDVKSMHEQINLGRGGLRVIAWLGGILIVVIGGAVWLGRHLK